MWAILLPFVLPAFLMAQELFFNEHLERAQLKPTAIVAEAEPTPETIVTEVAPPQAEPAWKKGPGSPIPGCGLAFNYDGSFERIICVGEVSPTYVAKFEADYRRHETYLAEMRQKHLLARNKTEEAVVVASSE